MSKHALFFLRRIVWRSSQKPWKTHQRLVFHGVFALNAAPVDAILFGQPAPHLYRFRAVHRTREGTSSGQRSGINCAVTASPLACGRLRQVCLPAGLPLQASESSGGEEPAKHITAVTWVVRNACKDERAAANNVEPVNRATTSAAISDQLRQR